MLVYGKHTVSSILKNNPKRALQLFVQQGVKNINEIIQLAKINGLKVSEIPKIELSRLSKDEPNHQGLMLKVKEFEYIDLSDEIIKKSVNCLMLDSIEDPRNLGRAARAAWAFGIDLLIISKDRSAKVTPVAEKSAVGAFDFLKVAQVTNLINAIDKFKKHGFFIFGAAGDSNKYLWNQDLTTKTCFVIGNEQSGLRSLVRKNCDLLLSIPMKEDISLNAADAAAIFLYEQKRQKSLLYKNKP